MREPQESDLPSYYVVRKNKMSIYKRPSGKWYAIIIVGRDTGGKIQRRSLGTFRTQKEAESAERKALEALENGIDLSPKTVTVADVMARYLADAEARCGAKTLERYREISNKNIVAHLGPTPLAKLKPAHLSEWLTKLLKSGGRKDKPLSPKSVRHAFGLLNAAVRWAVRMQLVARNACDAVRPPTVPRSDAKALTLDEISKLTLTAAGTRWEGFIALALATGARRGELCALTWADVDLDRAMLTISKSLSQTRDGLTVKSPKSGRTRSLPLSRFAIESLRRHKAMLAKERLAAGQAYEDCGLAFPDELGRRLTPMTATCAFERIAGKAKISTTRLHDVRHTAATTLLTSGVDIRTVSSIIGHANASTTLNVYSHVLQDVQHAAVDVLGDRLEQAVRGHQ